MLLLNGFVTAVDNKMLIMLSSSGYNGGSGFIDEARSVATDSQDNIIVVGKSNDNLSIVKYNKSLMQINSKIEITTGTGRGVTTDKLDNIIVISEKSNIQGIISYYTIKYDSGLNVISSTTYSQVSINNMPSAVAIDNEDNIIVTGYSSDGATLSWVTIKYDKDLREISSVIYDSGWDDRATSLAIDSQNNIIVSGYSSDGATLNWVTKKYDKNLNEIFSVIYDSGGIDISNAVAIDSQDNIIVSGYSFDGATLNWVTKKYDKDLKEISSVIYDSGGIDISNAVVIDSRDNISVTGYTDNEGTYDYHTIKYDKDLNKISSGTYNGGGIDISNAAAIDSQDNIIVSGKSADDFFTIKYLGSPQLTSASTGYQGETIGVIIDGRNFYNGAVVKFGHQGIIVSSSMEIMSNRIFANVTFSSSVPLGKHSIDVSNIDGETTTKSNIIEVMRRKLINSLNDEEINSVFDTGEIDLYIPAGTFLQDSTMTISSVDNALLQNEGMYTFSDVCVRINIEPQIVSQKEFILTLKYRDEYVAGLDKNRLVIVWYSSTTLSWYDIPSTQNIATNEVSCKTKNTNTIFALATLPPLYTNLSNVKAYPNPYKPGSNGDFDNTSLGEGMVFSNLTPEFNIKIFNIAGELVFEYEGESDVYGNYLWNTKNNQGAKLHSGLYIYFIKNDTQQKKGKVSIIR
ncbi:MAG: gliding motility-associated C-terminal domain-containing protein [Elusimicrobiota bacterium]